MKIFTNNISDKGLISRVYKKFLNLITKKRQPNYKVGKGLEQTFSPKNIQMANKHMKRWSTSLVIREMQIKTTVRHHFLLANQKYR